ncbi:MAG: hypothetical protein WC477_03655 [Patescibacteria group bacterium]
MNEWPPQNASETQQENAPEKFPSQEEIKSELERFCSGRAHKELRVESDEKGVLLYEIETTDERGDKVEYIFQRAKSDYQNKAALATMQFSGSIHSTLYSGDMPCGGECVANYLDGVWYPT